MLICKVKKQFNSIYMLFTNFKTFKIKNIIIN